MGRREVCLLHIVWGPGGNTRPQNLMFSVTRFGACFIAYKDYYAPYRGHLLLSRLAMP